MRIPLSSFRSYWTKQTLEPINSLIKKTIKDDKSLPYRSFSRLGYSAFNFENRLLTAEGFPERFDLKKIDEKKVFVKGIEYSTEAIFYSVIASVFSLIIYRSRVKAYRVK